ncbi:Unknown protein sequence [Pseudomonas syringae pv. maculicola]|nr:Unknown protein sequence [Pseudomonas syringae pv. maculicola]
MARYLPNILQGLRTYQVESLAGFSAFFVPAIRIRIISD